MKRFLALFLTIVMLLAMFVSCKPDTDPKETTPEVTTPEVTTPDPNQPVVPVGKTAGDIVAELGPKQTFLSTFGCQEAVFEGLTSSDEILNAFAAEGYTKLDVDMVEGAKFETILLNKADELVTVYWIPAEKEARVSWEKADADALSVLQKNTSTGGGTLTMVQIGVARGKAVDNPMIGMCYIFKLSNGRAMIIDGGYYYDDCAINIYNALAKLDIAKTEDDKYIIEAWIFTHGHGDHDGVLNNFVPLYGDKTEVNYFLYQFPANQDVSAVGGGLEGEEAFHELCQTAYPNATYINPRVGLNYYFGNATVSMLYTPDVMWGPGDDKITYYNDTSLIFKVSGGGTGFLCMGDAGEKAAARSWELFDATAYESGVLQITHHGLTTADGGNVHIWENIKKIYEAAGMSYAVLPMGTRIGDSVENGDWKSGNGRWAVIFQYAYAGVNGIGGQMSMFVKQGDAPTSNGYFGQELFNRFIATVETGFNYMEQQSPYFKNVKSLHGYNGINMIDNGDGLITYISSRDKEEMATVFQFASGGVTVKKNEELVEWLKLPEFNTADVITSIDSAAELFESTFETQEVVLKNVSDKASIVSAFTTRGFEAIDVTSVAGVKFETLLFTNGMELATVYFKPAENEARILFEKLDENVLPALTSNKETGTGEVTLVQAGECYVIKLSNGNAIVIDGGADNAKNAETIYNTLSKLNVARNAANQYVVEAWIFTNGSSNCNGVMNTFSKEYSKLVDVLSFLYQLPANGDVSATNASEAAFFDLCSATYPNAVYINPKAGLDYYFGNVTVSVLYTPDFVWSPENKIADYSNTGLVYKLSGGGVSVIPVSDAGEAALETVKSNYESSTLTVSELDATAAVFTLANGKVSVATNKALAEWLAEPTLTDSFASTFDSDMEIYTHAWDINYFIDQFKAEGYELVEFDMIEGAKFQTIMLSKEEKLITMYWFEKSGDLRIAYDTIDENALAPLTPNAETGKGEVTIIQIGVERDHRDPNIATDKGNPMIGMCYIMKLSNGKALIIDGGFVYDTNADNLYNALVKLDIAKDADGKYQIAAWIFSHGHGDHNGIMTSFGKKYADKTTVDYIMYQLPINKALSDTGAGAAGEATFHELCKTTYPNATYILPHAGQKYYFGNATIDVLYTPDFIWSTTNHLPDYNDTSIITRWNAGGTAFLCFGDAGEIPATAVWKNYDTSAFKSSILQITHHGLTTGANESQEWRNLKKIYESAGVDFVFMPMGAAWGARNGRWSVLCGWGYTGGQASFCLNRDDDAAGVDQTSYVNFVNGVRDGSIKDKTYLGYNGINIIDNGQGRITYIASSEDEVMATMFTFANGEATFEFNQKLYTWLEGEQ